MGPAGANPAGAPTRGTQIFGSTSVRLAARWAPSVRLAAHSGPRGRFLYRERHASVALDVEGHASVTLDELRRPQGYLTVGRSGLDTS
jgi:hypothetical protein